MQESRSETSDSLSRYFVSLLLYWTLLSWCGEVLLQVLLMGWLRWSTRKTTALAVAPDLVTVSEVVPEAAAEVDRMIRRFIEAEHLTMGRLILQTMLNLAFALLAVSFLMYGTYFRPNDSMETWTLVLILLSLLQSYSIYQSSERLRTGIQFIQKIMTTDTTESTLWRRMLRYYQRYFSTKTDGVLAEWILLFGEGIEIQVQVMM